jgi:hypothetical protein
MAPPKVVWGAPPLLEKAILLLGHQLFKKSFFSIPHLYNIRNKKIDYQIYKFFNNKNTLIFYNNTNFNL